MLKNSLYIIKMIEDVGFNAYIVGGFVRDYYMKKDSYDVDICTNAKPKDLIKIFSDATLPNEKYGAVTLYYKGVRYEITTFRKELKYINRRPVEIEYTNELYEDIERRDFTINDMCMNTKGEIIDLFNGKKDIDKKIIRCLGNADKKFNEDPLRILRAIRFATVLNFKLDKDVIIAINNNSNLLKDISYDRKKSELNKIFVSKNVKYGIKLICNLGLDKYLELNNLNKIKLTSDILGIWAQLEVLDKYPFTKIERDVITAVNTLLEHKKITKYDVYKVGLYNSSIAAEILGINKKNIVKMDRDLPIRNKEDIDISVTEILDLLNKEPGSFIKDIYSNIEYLILYSKLKNSNDKLREYIINNY